MISARHLALLLTILLGTVVSRAFAQDNTVIILHYGDAEMVTALDAELLAVGMEPMDVILKPSNDNAKMIRIAEQVGAGAGIQVGMDHEISVWVHQPVHGWQQTKLDVPKSSGEGIIALKSVELLQMKLRQHARSHIPKSENDNENEGADLDSQQLAAGLQPAAVYGFGNLSAALTLHFYAHFRFWRRVAVRLMGVAPTHPMRLSPTEGEVKVRIGTIGVGLFFDAPSLTQFEIRPSMGVSVGPAFFKARGKAESGYRDGKTLLVFPIGTTSAGLALSISRVWSVRGDLGVGLALKRPVIQVAGRMITAWGRPIIWGMVGIEARLF